MASRLRRLSHQMTEIPAAKGALNRLRHRGITPDDVFLASFPKSGNTWVKFMLAQLLSGEQVDFNSVERIVPDVGRHRDAPRLLTGGGRLIKTHEPLLPSLAPHYRRVIYIVRDGRDVAVSYYFSMLRTGLFEGAFDGFLDRFLRGEVGGFGAWHHHVSSWLAHPGVLVLRYEELLEAPVEGLARVSERLGLEPSAGQLDGVVRDNSADAMRAKEAGSRIERERVRGDINFVRSASSGGWREHFADQDNAAFMSVAGDAMRSAGYPA